MPTLNPYLNFPGNTEEAFRFCQSVFGGKLDIRRFKDMPETSNVPDNEKDLVMHAALPIGKNNVLMATDALDSMGHKVNAGNNFYISVSTDNKEEADKIFRGLSDGAKIEMEMGDTFWGAYFGMLKDKFGIQWMVSYDRPQGS